MALALVVAPLFADGDAQSTNYATASNFGLAVHLDDLESEGATASTASLLAFTGRFRVDRSTRVRRDQPKRSF